MILCICHCHVGLGYLRIPLGYNNKYVFNSEARLFVQTIKIIPLGYIYQFEWGVLRWRVFFFFFGGCCLSFRYIHASFKWIEVIDDVHKLRTFIWSLCMLFVHLT